MVIHLLVPEHNEVLLSDGRVIPIQDAPPSDMDEGGILEWMELVRKKLVLAGVIAKDEPVGAFL